MPRQRGETWAHQETTVFLTLFGETEVQEQLSSCHRNQAVYEDLAERMNDYGYARTPHQLRIKAKDLKSKYRHLKKTNQLNKEHSFWKYSHLLDSICHDPNLDPEAATSSSAKEDDEHSEGQGSASQCSDEICFDKSQDRGLPACTFTTSRRHSDASLVRAMRSSIVQNLPQRLLRHPSERATLCIAKTRKTRARNSKSMMEFNKIFLQCNRNIERFQHIFQDEMDMQRREREEIQKQTSRTTKETKAAASQMQKAILIQAAAINKVADAINRYSDLLECFSLQQSQQKAEKPIFHKDSSVVSKAAGQESCLPADWFGLGGR